MLRHLDWAAMEKEGRKENAYPVLGLAVAKAGRWEGSRIQANFCVLLTNMPKTRPNPFRELTHPVRPITHFIEKTLRVKAFNNLPEVVQW